MSLINEIREIENTFIEVKERQIYLEVFEEIISAPKLSKRILMIHGIAGVGKRSLLLKYAARCRELSIPIAMVSPDSIMVNSTVDVINKWADDLRLWGYPLPRLNEYLKRYDNIQEKTFNRRNELARIEKKTVSTLIEKPSRKTTPVDSILHPVDIGEASTKERLAFIGSSFNKSDEQLLNKPGEGLTEIMLDEMNEIAGANLLVLMIDSYERLKELETWIYKYVSSSAENILFVVAGQKPIDFQRPPWSTWLSKSQTEELKSMNLDSARQLVHHYFENMIGNPPKPTQEEAIARLSGGLPFFITTYIQLLSKNNPAEDFQPVGIATLEDVVEYLLKGIPKDIARLLEISTIVRGFNKNLITALMGNPPPDDDYHSLSTYEFVSTHQIDHLRIFIINYSLREIICNKLLMKEPENYFKLNDRAIDYYNHKLKLIAVSKNKRERENEYRYYSEELIYHLIRSRKESNAIPKSREIIDQALGNFGEVFANHIVQVLDDHLRDEGNRRWITYFQWFISKLAADIGDQDKTAKELIKLLAEPDLDNHLRGAIITMQADFPTGFGMTKEQRAENLERLINTKSLTEEESAKAYLYLGGVHRENIEWDKSISDFKKAYQSSSRAEDFFGLTRAMDSLAYTYLLMGDWDEALKWASEGVKTSRLAGGFWLTTALKTLGWVYTLRGELARGLNCINEALTLVKKRHDEAEEIKLTRRLADIFDRQGNWSDSNALYEKFIEKDLQNYRLESMSTYLALLGISYLKQGRYDEAKSKLLESLVHIDKHNDQNAYIGLGQVALGKGYSDEAMGYFTKASLISEDRPYYIVQAHLGLVLSSYMQGDFQKTIEWTSKVEQSAIKYRYFDVLAKLRLFQGDVRWKGDTKAWTSEEKVLFKSFQEALLFALQYNCYLLDEVLSSGIKGMPINSIIMVCRDRGVDGIHILANLRKWWSISSINSTDPNRGTKTSKKVSLQRAENLAYLRELGDANHHPSIIEQLDQILTA